MINLHAREPTDCETLDAYLVSMGIDHFTAAELLTMRRAGITVPEPPREWWPRIIPTLRAAEWLRERMGHPLIVGNCYRPDPYNRQVGGARRSQHLFFRAIDLDLPNRKRSHENESTFYSSAAELWISHGRELSLGLGLYRPWRGSRVHLDTGYRRRHWSKKYTAPLLESLR